MTVQQHSRQPVTVHQESIRPVDGSNRVKLPWIALKTHLGLFMADQCYQVVVNDS